MLLLGRILTSSFKPCYTNPGNIAILKGVFNLLTKLDQKGFLLGLVTGNLEKIARAKSKKIGINQFFKFGGFGCLYVKSAVPT